MKKILSLTLFALLLINCTSEDNDAVNDTTNPPATNPVTATKLFGYINSSNFVELNRTTGATLSTIASGNNDYIDNLVYYEPANEILGQLSTEVTPGVFTYTFYRLNTTTGLKSHTSFEGYENFTVSGSRLFAFTKQHPMDNQPENYTIVELNPANGQVIATIAHLGDTYLDNFVYHAETQQFLAQTSTTEVNGGISYKFAKISLVTGAITQSGYVGYENFVVAGSKLYAYKAYNGFVELNPSTGAQVASLAQTGESYIGDLVYLGTTNEIAGQKTISGNGIDTYKYIRINLANGAVTESLFGGFENFIVSNR